MTDMVIPLYVHPVQRPDRRPVLPAQVSTLVTARAWEAYDSINRNGQSNERIAQRGGFSTEELVALLYARSFPRCEWSARQAEAFRGMRL